MENEFKGAQANTPDISSPLLQMLLNWQDWRGAVREALKRGDAEITAHTRDIRELFQLLSEKASADDFKACKAACERHRSRQTSADSQKASNIELAGLSDKVQALEVSQSKLWVLKGVYGTIGAILGAAIAGSVVRFLFL